MRGLVRAQHAGSHGSAAPEDFQDYALSQATCDPGASSCGVEGETVIDLLPISALFVQRGGTYWDLPGVIGIRR